MKIRTVSVGRAQQVLSLGRTKIYELMASRQLERLKVGRRTLISAKSIKAFQAKMSLAAEVSADRDPV